MCRLCSAQLCSALRSARGRAHRDTRAGCAGHACPAAGDHLAACNMLLYHRPSCTRNCSVSLGIESQVCRSTFHTFDRAPDCLWTATTRMLYAAGQNGEGTADRVHGAAHQPLSSGWWDHSSNLLSWTGCSQHRSGSNASPSLVDLDRHRVWCRALQVVKSLAALNTADSSAVSAFLEDTAAITQPDQVPSPLHPSSSNHAQPAAGGSGGGGKAAGRTTGGTAGGSTADASDDWRALSVQ